SILLYLSVFGLFFSSRRRHTRSKRDWSSDVCSSDLYFYRRVSLFHQRIHMILESVFFVFSFCYVSVFSNNLPHVIPREFLPHHRYWLWLIGAVIGRNILFLLLFLQFPFQ